MRKLYGYPPASKWMNDKRTNWAHWYITFNQDGEEWYQYLPSYMGINDVNKWTEEEIGFNCSNLKITKIGQTGYVTI